MLELSGLADYSVFSFLWPPDFSAIHRLCYMVLTFPSRYWNKFYAEEICELESCYDDIIEFIVGPQHKSQMKEVVDGELRYTYSMSLPSQMLTFACLAHSCQVYTRWLIAEIFLSLHACFILFVQCTALTRIWCTLFLAHTLDGQSSGSFCSLHEAYLPTGNRW